MHTVQYRVMFSKTDEAVEGPDNADVVVRIASKDSGLNLSLAFMTGKLKAQGRTGVLFNVLSNGDADAVISRLASRA
ncbi:hypothetical protein LBMAG13_08230 [Actinomycetes bacterium]|nr:hypothetical protein LBMAG13_08230 [Actinomycetes bacterium]